MHSVQNDMTEQALMLWKLPICPQFVFWWCYFSTANCLWRSNTQIVVVQDLHSNTGSSFDAFWSIGLGTHISSKKSTLPYFYVPSMIFFILGLIVFFLFGWKKNYSNQKHKSQTPAEVLSQEQGSKLQYTRVYTCNLDPSPPTYSRCTKWS